MSLINIMDILKELNIPVAYSHFKKAQNSPYICYLVDSNDNFSADNKVYKKINNINIELYTEKKDLEIEEQLEKILDNNNIFYESTESFIDSEDVFVKIYKIGVI